MFICLNSQTLKSCALIHSERTTRYTVLQCWQQTPQWCASAFFHNFHWCNTMSSLTYVHTEKKAKINEWKLSKLYTVEIYLQNQHNHLELRFVAVCWLRGSKPLRVSKPTPRSIIKIMWSHSIVQVTNCCIKVLFLYLMFLSYEFISRFNPDYLSSWLKERK